MDLSFIDFVLGYFTRNRNALIISLGIFIFTFLTGALTGFFISWGNHGFISSGVMSGTVQVDFNRLFLDIPSLFLHNFSIDFSTLLLGFLFSIGSVIIFLINAFLIGMPFGEDFALAFFGVAPHGIFEYSASLFALVGAFLITGIEIDIIKSLKDKNKSIGNVIYENRVKLKDIILSLIFLTVLLAIASVIEGQITPRILIFFFTGKF